MFSQNTEQPAEESVAISEHKHTRRQREASKQDYQIVSLNMQELLVRAA